MSGYQRELFLRIDALYQRVRENALLEADIVPVSKLLPENVQESLRLIASDPAALETILPGFQKPFAVFRFGGVDETVLNVGAHWGYSAVAMRNSGCRSHILSIEAMPANATALAYLKSLQADYDFINSAASDTSGMLRFYIPAIDRKPILGLSTTGGTLQRHYVKMLAQIAVQQRGSSDHQQHVGLVIVEVPAAPIDELVGDGRPIAAIKIDVEGHEPAAIRGARRVLTTDKPLIMIEGANRDAGVAEQLTALGYFHCVLVDGMLTRHAERSTDNDGYWLHPDKTDYYRSEGLIAF
jgi:FkbM family methyltransferase